MGMSSPAIPGQVQSFPTEDDRKHLTTASAPPRRNRSTASSLSRRDSGLNRRALTARATGTEPTRLVRKKLPWLDGGQQPKSGQPPDDPELRTSLETFTVPDATSSPEPASGKRASMKSLGDDPSLRATGSDPTLGDRPRSVHRPRTLSLTSNPRPGVKPVASKRQARRALGAISEKESTMEDYTPSEYSTTISSDLEHAPPPETGPAALRLPKKDPASYERLVQRATARKHTSQGHSRATQKWLRSQLDLPLGEIAPTSVLIQQAPLTPPAVPEALRESRRAASVPAQEPARQGTTVPKPQPAGRKSTPVARAVAKVTASKKPTLFDLPTHLMSSSTSTSPDIPDHLRFTSTEFPSASSDPSRRASALLRGQEPSVVPNDTGVQRSATNVSPKASLRDPLPTVPPLVAVKSRKIRRENRSLGRAATGMNNLMDDAVTVARDAASSGRSDEVAHILDSAAAALRNTRISAPPPRRSVVGHGITSSPLEVSPHQSSGSSDSDSDIDLSSGIPSTLHTREPSNETAPTLLTRSAQSSFQPLVVEQYTRDGKAPASARAIIEDAQASGSDSISPTPPRLYQPASAESIVRDFAYAKMRTAQAQSAQSLSAPAGVGYGAAADYYNDHGESVALQPGLRRSIALEKMPGVSVDKPLPEKPLPAIPEAAQRPLQPTSPISRLGKHHIPAGQPQRRRLTQSELRELEHVTTNTVPPKRVDSQDDNGATVPQRRKRDKYHPHLSDFFELGYYRHPENDHADAGAAHKRSTVTDSRSVPPPVPLPPGRTATTFAPAGLPARATGIEEGPLAKQSPRKHLSLQENQGFSLGRYHRRQPIAREWNVVRKRITAAIACVNTIFIGLIAGIYAGEVPKIQYQLQDTKHQVILGNVLLFAGLGLSTLIFWPLPLLHGRKPYTLMAFAIMLPLQFPQALAVSDYHNPDNPLFRCGLLIPRVLTGIALGFANMNQLPTLFDLFGISLMSEAPHQEMVVADDVRRQGGGVGLWLGFWSFCFVGSLSIGFCLGACIISGLDPSWGFYIVVILLAFFLLVNVIAPETRRAPYRRSIAHFFDGDEKLKRRVARGEVKLHISNEGPRWWFQEVWAGLILTKRMLFQPGFFVLASYIAWIYAQVTMVILLLGALLSRDYKWQPQYVGLATLSLAIGALLAMPLAKASLFSRSRFTPQRTDSMTMRAPRLTWSSHLVRRCIFTLLLPFAGLAYTLSASGPSVSWTSPTIFCGLVGFLSNLAIAECVGLIMEVFDTCDLQPGVNQKHRLQSMAETTRRRRTNYSSFPRVCAGFFAAQSLGFFLAAAATGVSGVITRALGAQEAVACVAAILLAITVLFMLVMFRFKEVQVIPNGVFDRATKKGSIAWGPGADDPEWKAVVIGNPSQKMRRVNLLELGSYSRWTEIRRLNKLMRS